MRIQYEEKKKPENSEVPQKSDKLATVISCISAFLMIVTVVCSIQQFHVHSDIPLIFGGLFIISIVLAIIVRILYPKNKFGKVIMRIYIGIVIAVVLLVILFIISCSMAADSLTNSFCDCMGGCGRIG